MKVVHLGIITMSQKSKKVSMIAGAIAECHLQYKSPNGRYEVDARTILNSLAVITFEDSGTMPFDIHSKRPDAKLVKEIEHHRIAAIAKKNRS